jgi:hypothetical protein
MLREGEPASLGRDKGQVLLAAGGYRAHLAIGPAPPVVAPPDEPVPAAHVDGVFVTKLDVGENGSDRAREIRRVDTSTPRPARRIDHHGRKLSTQRTARFRSQ